MFCRACGADIPDNSGYVCPKCGQHPGTPDANSPDFSMAEPHARTGPDFEQRDRLGFFAAWMSTAKGVLTDPVRTFETMRLDDITSPVIFAITNGVIAGVISGVWMFFWILIMGAAGLSGNPNGPDPIAMLGGAAVAAIVMPLFYIIGMPMVALLQMFIGGCINHVCLLVVGGAKNGIEATFRVGGYCTIFMVLGAVVPPIPCIIQLWALAVMIWSFVVVILALREAHNAETWQAVVAVLLPTVVICGIVLAFFFLVIAAGAAGGSSGGNFGRWP